MSERKTSIRNLKPGDKVVLRMHSFRELSGSGSNRKRKIKARVVAIYPHYIQFRTAFGYMTTPCFTTAEEMVSGVEHHGRCPGNERAIDRRAGGKTRKGWKVYE